MSFMLFMVVHGNATVKSMKDMKGRSLLGV